MPENDQELAAMQDLAEHLDSLSRASCLRVLRWAEDRYTKLEILDSDVGAFSRFVDALTEAARQIGDVTPIEIVRFAENVQKYERERMQKEETEAK